MAKQQEEDIISAILRRRLVFATPPFGSGGVRHIVKRSCPRDESPVIPGWGRVDVRDTEMLENEVWAIEYVRQHTTIFVPRIVSVFEHRDCVYMIQEFIEMPSIRWISVIIPLKSMPRSLVSLKATYSSSDNVTAMSVRALQVLPSSVNDFGPIVLRSNMPIIGHQ